MKATSLRNAAALAALLALGACGGKASFELAGVLTDVYGAAKPLGANGLVLANGDQRLDVPFGATTFKFPNSVSYGTEYAMTVAQQPAHMTCNFSRGASGTAGRTASIQAVLICNQNSYSIGGVVKGLGSANTLDLTNGTDKLTITVNQSNVDAEGNLKFTMPTSVPYGTVYGVTVLNPPAGQKCTVTNGTDVMGDTPRNNIVVTCVFV